MLKKLNSGLTKLTSTLNNVNIFLHKTYISTSKTVYLTPQIPFATGNTIVASSSIVIVLFNLNPFIALQAALIYCMLTNLIIDPFGHNENKKNVVYTKKQWTIRWVSVFCLLALYYKVSVYALMLPVVADLSFPLADTPVTFIRFSDILFFSQQIPEFYNSPKEFLQLGLYCSWALFQRLMYLLLITYGSVVEVVFFADNTVEIFSLRFMVFVVKTNMCIANVIYTHLPDTQSFVKFWDQSVNIIFMQNKAEVFYENLYREPQAILNTSPERAALVDGLINESNVRKVIHTVPLNLNVNRYSRLNTNFPSYGSAMILTLTVWQYWWWMSFVFVMVLFNRVVVKIFFQNTLKIEPKTHTSIKSNGRWGDLMASLFPVFWCSNILVNSNFILRVIENHTEAGAYVLRIRGKQWYWVYKFSVNLKQDLNNMSIIIGRGNKINVTYGLLSEHARNITIPSSRWDAKIEKFRHLNQKITKDSLVMSTHKINDPSNLFSEDMKKRMNFHKTILKLKIAEFVEKFNIQQSAKHDKHYLMNRKRKLLVFKTYKCSGNKLLVLKYHTNHGYRPYNRFFYSIQQQPKSAWKVLKKNNIIYFNSEKSFDLTNRDKVKVKKIKPISSEKRKHFLKRFRLISSYNTLILPINVNITVITNSFDVVHSWFVPGLGLKFDCVPGRSTHYTLRVHKPGIYYGHCAEVCGRMHHHMPIRVCALPMNQFMYYYNTYYKI